MMEDLFYRFMMLILVIGAYASVFLFGYIAFTTTFKQFHECDQYKLEYSRLDPLLQQPEWEPLK